MHIITALTPDELIAETYGVVERLCNAAFQIDCRVAIRWRLVSITAMMAEYEFLILSPGEQPPPAPGWEVWENHSGLRVGRPA